MEKLKDLPELSTGAIVVITFFVMAALLMAWELYNAPVMDEEDEEWDRYYDELYKWRTNHPGQSPTLLEKEGKTKPAES